MGGGGREGPPPCAQPAAAGMCAGAARRACVRTMCAPTARQPSPHNPAQCAHPHTCGPPRRCLCGGIFLYCTGPVLQPHAGQSRASKVPKLCALTHRLLNTLPPTRSLHTHTSHQCTHSKHPYHNAAWTGVPVWPSPIQCTRSNEMITPICEPSTPLAICAGRWSGGPSVTV